MVACIFALPTDPQNNKNGANPQVSQLPVQSSNVPQKTLTSPNDKPKRDTSSLDTRKYNTGDNSSPSVSASKGSDAPQFVRPVPVSQVFGKTDDSKK